MTAKPASAPQSVQDILAEMMGYSPECERFAERIGTALAFGAKRDPASAQVREGEPECQMLWHPRSNGKRFWKVFVCQKCGVEVEADSHPVRQCPAAEPVLCVAADDTPSKSRAKRIALEKGESVAVAQDVPIVGYLIRWNSGQELISPISCHRDDGTSEPLCTIADHARIVAELEAKVQRDHHWITDLLAANAGLEASLGACRALPVRWRELAKEQDDRAASAGLTEAEREWHLARAQQAEDCADELEAAARSQS